MNVFLIYNRCLQELNIGTQLYFKNNLLLYKYMFKNKYIYINNVHNTT